MPKLSCRLETLLDMTPRCALVADIGADHAFLTIELLRREKAQHVLCTDLSPHSLNKAKEAVLRADCAEQVTLCQGDGLAAIDGYRPEAIVIAGMGGETISAILEGAQEDFSCLYLLQAMSRTSFLRAFLSGHGFAILDERLAKDEGRIYPILAVRRQAVTEQPSPAEIYCGAAHLSRADDPLTAEYLHGLVRSLMRRKEGRQTAGLNTQEETDLIQSILCYLKTNQTEFL